MYDNSCSSLWPGVSIEEVHLLREAASLLCSSSVIWLPDYGCAVVKLPWTSSSNPEGIITALTFKGQDLSADSGQTYTSTRSGWGSLGNCTFWLILFKDFNHWEPEWGGWYQEGVFFRYAFTIAPQFALFHFRYIYSFTCLFVELLFQPYPSNLS